MLNTHALINPSPSDNNLRPTNPWASDKLSFRHFTQRKLIQGNYEMNPSILKGGGITSLKVPAATEDKISLNGLHVAPLPHYDFWNSSMAPQPNPLTA